jgi:hypothetical protein
MLDHPLEFALIDFKGSKFSGKIVPELLDLAERGIVRFVDIAFIQKEKDGTTRTVELNDLDPKSYKEFVPLGKHVQSLFTEEDLQIEAGKLRKNTAAMLILWENVWLDNIRKAVAEAGGTVVERGQISPDIVKQIKKTLPAAKAKKPVAKKQLAAAKKPAAKKK